MPSYKYGARTFTIEGAQATSQAATTVNLGGWIYMPAATDAAATDKMQEYIIAGALVFMGSVATAASTLAAGANQYILYQYNSGGNSVNSAVLFNQVASSAAALATIDTTSLHKWALSTGDVLYMYAVANTAANAAMPGVLWSGTVGTQHS